MKENDRLHGVAWKLQQEADDEQDSKAEAAEAGNESGQQAVCSEDRSDVGA